MTITDKLKGLKSEYPEKIALVDLRNRREASFSEIDAESERAVSYLRKAGFKEGDRIILFIPVSIDFYVVLLALFKMGIQAVFIDPYAGISHINKCSSLVSPKGIIGDWKILFLGSLLKEIRKIPLKINYRDIFSEKSTYENHTETDINSITEDTPALISFTSGSTGFPKVIMRTHGFLLGQHNVLERNLKFGENTGVYSSFPMFLLSHMAGGSTTVIPDIDFRKPARTGGKAVLDQLRGSNAKNIVLPPSILENLTEYMLENAIRMEGMETVYTGGAPVFPGLMDSLAEAFPRCRIRALYGASEAEPISLLNYEDITEREREGMKEGKGLLVGNKVNEIEIKINGETGEISVKGENVLKGYLQDNDNGKNSDSDMEKWHDTGDTGYLDNGGRLFLLGRLKGIIRIKGQIYYPFSIETAFSFCKGIKKSALAVKDDRLYLIVEKKKGFTGKLEEDMEVAKLKEKFGIFKIIEEKIPVDKRHNSKVDYRKLEKIMEKY